MKWASEDYSAKGSPFLRQSDKLRPTRKLGIHWISNILFHHSSIERDPFQALTTDGARGSACIDGLDRQPFHPRHTARIAGATCFDPRGSVCASASAMTDRLADDAGGTYRR